MKWFNVANIGIASVSGDGIFKLTTLGIHLYSSEAAARSAAPQQVTQTQGDGVLQNLLSGGGIGHGFGLGQDIGQLGQDAAKPITSVAGFLAELSSRELWVRIAKVAIGAALVIAGVVQLASPAAAPVLATAAKVIK
jgi:hypothetical protein